MSISRLVCPCIVQQWLVSQSRTIHWSLHAVSSPALIQFTEVHGTSANHWSAISINPRTASSMTAIQLSTASRHHCHQLSLASFLSLIPLTVALGMSIYPPRCVRVRVCWSTCQPQVWNFIELITKPRSCTGLCRVYDVPHTHTHTSL